MLITIKTCFLILYLGVLLYNFSDTTVIIPTFNESENVPKLLSLLIQNYKGIRAIVSDDGSTDGTKEKVLKMSKKYKSQVYFLDRSKSSVHGLTASVIDAATIVKTKKTVVMDGDMQHPFEKVKDLSKKLDDYDLAICVRTRVKDWGISRRIMSKCMATFVYTVFKLRGKPTCKDMMTGFFGIRTELFKSVIKKNERAYVGSGYKVLLDTLRIIGKNITIVEVGYATFHNRKHGESKLGMNQIINTIKSTLS